MVLNVRKKCNSNRVISALKVVDTKGPVNNDGNTGPGNFQRDHRFFLPFRHTGPQDFLNVEYMGPPVVLM